MQALPDAVQARVNYDSFDGLRGVAALAVVIYHMAPLAGTGQIMPHGYLAVDLFFVLSGFVIAKAYGARLRAGMGLRKFMAARLMRLYPLFFLGQVLGFAVMAVTGHDPAALAQAFAAGALLLPLPVSFGEISLIYALNSPSWSLFFELAINLAFVFLVLVTRRRLVQLILVSALALIATALRYGSLDVGWNLGNFAGGVPRVAFSFLVGMYLAQSAPAMRSGNGLPLALILAVLALVLMPVRAWWFDALTVLFVLPAVVYRAASRQPTGLVARVSRQLGRISYPVYIIHAPLLHLGDWLIRAWQVPAALHPLAWAAILAIILLLSELAVSHYDQPVRRGLPRVLDLVRRPGRPA